MYTVSYSGFLGDVTRTFLTYRDAIDWLYKIGKPELISSIIFANDTTSESEPVLDANGKSS